LSEKLSSAYIEARFDAAALAFLKASVFDLEAGCIPLGFNGGLKKILKTTGIFQAFRNAYAKRNLQSDFSFFLTIP